MTKKKGKMKKKNIVRQFPKKKYAHIYHKLSFHPVAIKCTFRRFLESAVLEIETSILRN